MEEERKIEKEAGRLPPEGVHKKKEIYLLLGKLDDRKLNIVYRFIKRIAE